MISSSSSSSSFFQRKRKRPHRENALLAQLTSGRLEVFRRAPTGSYLFHTVGLLPAELWNIISSYTAETRGQLLRNLVEAYLDVAHPTSRDICRQRYRREWRDTGQNMECAPVLYNPRYETGRTAYELGNFLLSLWWRARDARLGKDLTIQLFVSLMKISGLPEPFLWEDEQSQLLVVRLPNRAVTDYFVPL